MPILQPVKKAPKPQRQPKGTPIDGWINFNKPVGMTSSQVVGFVKWALGARKVGHGGTLDPLAEGVLPLALGKATKTMQFSLDANKTYAFTITFGEQRSTDDAEGEVLENSTARPTRAELEAILPQFTGDITQTPPLYSALKIDGKAAYARARAGEVVDIAAKTRTVTVFSLELEDFTGDTATLIAKTSKGTYIRSLARDIGRQLGCLGYISYLQRTQAGAFTLENAIAKADFEAWVASETTDKGLDKPSETTHIPFLHPVDTILADIPEYVATGAEIRDLKLGRTLKRIHLKPGRLRMMTQAGKLLSLVMVDDKGVLKIERNFG